MEQQSGVAEGSLGISAGMVLPPRHQVVPATPHGTLTGTVLTITILLLGYVGVGFVRLLF